MMRGLFLSVLSMALTVQLTGCSLFSSDKAENESEATEQVESTDEVSSDSTEEKSEGDSSNDEAASADDALFDESSDSSAGASDAAKTDIAQTTEGGSSSDDTAFPETPMDETKTTADTGVKLEEASSGTLDSSSDSGTLDSSSSSSDTLSASNEPTPVTTEDVAAAAAETSDVSTPVVPSTATLRKVESAPFKRAGVLLNRVYVARDGDTWKSVSERIYGKNRTKEFKKWNPSIKRNLKVGDKVYYASTKAPDDNAQMLTYFEENGVTPLTYTAKAGDDLKSVGKQLLGNSRSWMELYATNPNLESKDALSEGTEIKYWGSDALASIAPPTQSTPTMAQAPDMGSNSMPPTDMNSSSTPPTDIAMNQAGDVPPPPPADASQAPVEDPFAQTPPPADAGSVPPPPPPADLGNPSAEAAPPPPPADAASEDVSAETDPNADYMIIGGAAILILALVVFIIKRRKKNEIDLGQTQV